VSLTFFTDHCVPAQVSEMLRRTGHQVFLLRDTMAHDAPDEHVLAKAQSLDAIMVSLNGDFADIVRYPPQEHGGIIALQLKGHPRALPAIMEILSSYLGDHTDRGEYRGKLLLVEASRIRLRQ